MNPKTIAGLTIALTISSLISLFMVFILVTVLINSVFSGGFDFLSSIEINCSETYSPAAFAISLDKTDYYCFITEKKDLSKSVLDLNNPL